MDAHWDRVRAEAARLRGRHLRDLFSEDAKRFDRFSFALDDLTLDISKEKIDGPALDALLALARAAGLEDRRRALFAGEHVNTTEDRAALHMALRGGAAAPADDDVAAVRDRFLGFAEAVRTGEYSAAGQPFTDIINIGIGGSDLGPEMVSRALAPNRDGPRLHFVSNVDGAEIADVTRDLDPARTLVVVASKSFTTLETMTNARSARDWLKGAVDEPGRHVVAVSTNVRGAEEFGIDRSRVFGFWTGSAAAIPYGPRSACRSPSASGRTAFASSSPARRPWTRIFARPRSSGTCPFSWAWSPCGAEVAAGTPKRAHRATERRRDAGRHDRHLLGQDGHAHREPDGAGPPAAARGRGRRRGWRRALRAGRRAGRSAGERRARGGPAGRRSLQRRQPARRR